ncbi:MAG: NADH-quinone oxidoreductase subunit NuoH [Chloroflexota bacterium]|nr:MAG: NADH-quinone oxidoreductase subunit NuoH [Chloroflexota bacterium]
MQECIDIFNTFAGCLTASGADPGLAQFLSILLGVVLVAMGPLVIVIFLIWVERKYAARVQDRLGPNRVGPFGLLQTFADALKLITKEDITPAGADKLIYNLAPIISVVSVILIWAVVPISPLHIGADLSIGALYFVAVGSIGTLAIMMAGWSSNNKYALLGAFRVVAQLVSYEVPLVFSLLVPVMFAGTMSMQGIVEAQLGMWFIVFSPLAALIFFISTQAETGRAPFDLIEAESELVAGYNIEYSGMKFGLFFAGEFLHVFTNALIFAILFTGGWLGPFVYQVPALGIIYLFAKGSIFYLLSLHLRNTLPRIRIDQLMSFNWKFLVPVSIANLILVAFLWKVIQLIGLLPGPENASDFLAHLPAAIIMLVGNLALTVVVLQMLRNVGRRAVAANAVSTPANAELDDQPYSLPVPH